MDFLVFFFGAALRSGGYLSGVAFVWLIEK